MRLKDLRMERVYLQPLSFKLDPAPLRLCFPTQSAELMCLLSVTARLLSAVITAMTRPMTLLAMHRCGEQLRQMQ